MSKKQIVKKCLYCKEEFLAQPNSIYCSKKCKEQDKAVKKVLEWLKS